MNGAGFARSDVVVLGALALLVAAALLIPWSKIGPMLEQKPPGDYGLAKIRQDLARTSRASPDWRAGTDYAARMHYSPESGALQVTLSHRHNAPVEGLSLRADFSGAGGGPAASAWLRHEYGGRYSAENMSLPKGDLILSLTGSRNAEPLFRLEHRIEID